MVRVTRPVRRRWRWWRGWSRVRNCIEDMDLLRHGGMGRLSGRVRAPSTLGSFLRGLSMLG